jgi:hypothetical protein
VCALSYFLERSGLLTAGISLVREHAEAMQPPRSLWVPFPLGRPLGSPNDPDFQHRVLAAGLALLHRSKGPVLEDYPEDAPAIEADSAPACPVSFPPPEAGDTWRDRLTREYSSLEPWYELGRTRRGRTLVGVSEIPVRENLLRLADHLDSGQLPSDDLVWLKRAIDDIRSFYLEALTAQPGTYDQNQVDQMVWSETRFGAALAELHQAFSAHPDFKPFARIILPRSAQHHPSTEGKPA